MTKASRERSLIADLKQYIALAQMDSKTWIVLAVLGSVGLAVLDTLGVAAMAPLMQLFTDPAAPNGVGDFLSDLFDISTTATLIVVIAGIVTVFFIAKSVGTIFFRWWLLGRTTRIAADASTALMRKFTLEPYAMHRGRQAARVQRDVNGSNEQAASVLLAVVGMISDLLVLCLLALVLFVVSPVVALIAAVLFGGVLASIQRILRRHQTRIGVENAEAGLNSLQYLMPALYGFRDVRLSGTAGDFADGYWEARLKFARATRALSLAAELPRYLMEVVLLLAIVGIALFLFNTGTPDEALTVLAVFAAASLRALPTLNRVGASLATVRSSRVGLTIVLDASAELEAETKHEEIPRGEVVYRGDLELKDVTLQYRDADHPTLNGISLLVKENSTVAFTGSSGAGKSTLVDIFLGLLEPTEGQVLCGETDISDDLAAWHLELGVVSQDVYLLNDSVARNVAFGPRGTPVDQAKLERVLKLAQLDDVIAELPDGADTIIGERGVRLSGGQRQRLGIARALYREPKYLVLDEATSSLDNLTEHAIAQLLGKLKGSLTVIIVAHRLSTVRHADKVIYLSKGQIQAEGSFDEVRAQSEEFAQLVELGRLG